MAAFKKELSAHKALMAQQKIDEALVLQKKQYIELCKYCAGKNKGDGVSMKFTEMAKLLVIAEDDVEEWVINAMGNGVLEAKIDQIEELVVIKSIQPLSFSAEEWKGINLKLAAWRQRFERIEKILEVQPDAAPSQ